MDGTTDLAAVLVFLDPLFFHSLSPYDTIIYAHRHSSVPEPTAKNSALLERVACRTVRHQPHR